MKKVTALTLALFVSLTTATLVPAPSPSNAASAKEWVQISEQIGYYGELKNGVPHGRGTMKWGDSKQYSGDFIDGKRTGTGKYINEYILESEQQKVVYIGAWKQDQMDGNGILTHKRTQQDGTVRMNKIQSGTFKSGSFQYGYDVIHAIADPDFSFSYRNTHETLKIMGSNMNMKASLKKGVLFSAEYRNGSIHKSYSIFPEATQAKQRKNDADLKYLQNIQVKLNPYLEEFERLSKHVPLN